MNTITTYSTTWKCLECGHEVTADSWAEAEEEMDRHLIGTVMDEERR